jgi:medium-chain acyl-[acyl-carrier-protein] hydrolase
MVAFELTRRLRRDYDRLPLHLVVSGHSAPQIPDRRPPIHALPDEAFIAELRKLNGTPDEILQNQELLGLLIPILRADFQLSETYEYQPEAPLAAPMAAFGGLGDPFINREELEAWAEHTTAGFRVRMFPGDHFYLNTNRGLLLQALARELAPYLI